jgi:hypothetical protein
MMVTKREWEIAYRAAIARGREHVDPPAPDEIVAFSRGELPPDEMERVREALAYYPNLALAVSGADDRNEHAPLLNDEELSADWDRLRKSLSAVQSQPLHIEPGQVATRRASRERYFAIAASVFFLLALSGLFVQSRTITALREELLHPRAHVERIVLLDDTSRGGPPSASATFPLRPETQSVVLVLTLPEEQAEGAYRVEIADLQPASPVVVWQSAIERGRDRTFTIEVPSAFLRSPQYRITLYRDDQPVARYSLSPGTR